MTTAAHNKLVGDIVLEISPHGLVWENQTGQGWAGKFVGKRDNRVVLENARPIRFGLPGSSDILALISGRLVTIEAKTGTGRLQANQQNFRKAVHAAGGLFIEARSVTDVIDALRIEGLIDRRDQPASNPFATVAE